MTREARKGLLERNCAGPGLQSCRSIDGYEGAFLQDGDAVRQKFDFRECVRCEKQGSALAFKDFGLQETPEVGRGQGIQAARGFIEKEHLGLMENRSNQAEPLDGAGGQGAHLPVERIAQLKTFGQSRDTSSQDGIGEMIQPAEETQIFSSGQAREKAQVGTCVVA